jgi:hypothetical protein
MRISATITFSFSYKSSEQLCKLIDSAHTTGAGKNMTKPESISLWHQACHHHYNFEQKIAKSSEQLCKLIDSEHTTGASKNMTKPKSISL